MHGSSSPRAPVRAPIALVGLMGAGKSLVAERIAARLGGAALDLDAVLEHEAGRSVAEQFAHDGEAAFRARERRALARVLAEPPAVLACGGGAVLDPDSRRLLRERCRVAWLEVAPATAARRAAVAPGARSLLAGGDPEARLAALLAERADLYAEVAHVRVTTDGRSPDEVAEAVLLALAGLA